MATSIPDEQAALLAAIVAEPGDDTPRLVYADWLQKHGDVEQSQFIRDWISFDRLDDYEDDQCQKLVKRLNGEAMRNGLRWLEAVGIKCSAAVYDRGMVEGVIYTNFVDFQAHAPQLFSRAPVRDLTIGGKD